MLSSLCRIYCLNEAPPRPVAQASKQEYDKPHDYEHKGLDIACWDIAGKFSNQPISRMLGGAFRDSLTAYATGCYYRGEDYLSDGAGWSALRKEAESYVTDGFRRPGSAIRIGHPAQGEVDRRLPAVGL